MKAKSSVPSEEERRHIFHARQQARTRRRLSRIPETHDTGSKWMAWLCLVALIALSICSGPASGQTPTSRMPPRGATNAYPASVRPQIPHRPMPPRQPVTATGWATSTSGIGKVHALSGTKLVCHTPLKSWVRVPTGPATCIKCLVLTGKAE